MYLWLQCSLCTAGIVQADAFVHAIVRGEVVAHLVAVATALVLGPAVGAALGLRRLLRGREDGGCRRGRGALSSVLLWHTSRVGKKI